MTVRHAVLPGPLGPLTALADGEVLVGLYFPGHTYPPAMDQAGEQVDPAADELFTRLQGELEEYFAGTSQEFSVPLAARGDAFSERVWARLCEIPYGSTVSYGEIARELGSAGLAQRVGQAVGHNPLSILVPCHRVVGADGSLTGYAGGLERKRALLTLEEPSAEDGARLF